MQISAKIKVMNNVDAHVDDVVVTTTGYSIAIVVPRAVKSEVIELNRAELHEFIIRTQPFLEVSTNVTIQQNK